jgi:hypothetical protein
MSVRRAMRRVKQQQRRELEPYENEDDYRALPEDGQRMVWLQLLRAVIRVAKWKGRQSVVCHTEEGDFEITIKQLSDEELDEALKKEFCSPESPENTPEGENPSHMLSQAEKGTAH